MNSRRGKGATFWIELFYPLAKSSEIQAAILQEDRLTTPAFATAATIHEVQRWPVVAFAEDVKPPMLSGAVSHQPSNPLPPSPPPPPLPPPPPPSFSFSPPSDASFIAPSLSRLGSDAPLLDNPRVSEGINTGNEKLHQVQEIPKPSKAEVSIVPENKDIDDDGPLVVLVVDDNLITRSTMTR